MSSLSAHFSFAYGVATIVPRSLHIGDYFGFGKHFDVQNILLFSLPVSLTYLLTYLHTFLEISPKNDVGNAGCFGESQQSWPKCLSLYLSSQKPLDRGWSLIAHARGHHGCFRSLRDRDLCTDSYLHARIRSCQGFEALYGWQGYG